MAPLMRSQGGGGQSGGGGGDGGGRGGQISGGDAGMKITLCAFPSPMTEECNSKILEMGGTVLGSLDYETATHIAAPVHAQEGAELILTPEGKKVIDCINMCYSRGERLPQNHNLGVSALKPSEEPCGRTCEGEEGGMCKRRAQKDSWEERKELVHKPTRKHAVNGVISTSSYVCCSKWSVKRKLDYGSASAKVCDLGPSVGFEGDVYHKHHQLFVCKEDKSDWTSLFVYSIINKGKLTTKITTPGSGGKHSSVTTSNELKLHVSNSYKLLKSLHKAGLTLRGEFESKNFFVDSYNNMRLGNLQREVIKKLKVGDSDIDTWGFVSMITNEIFSDKPKPSDMLQWIDLVNDRKSAFDDLATNSILLMDEYKGAAHFMSLYDEFKDMESSDRLAYTNVKKDLNKYKYWQTLVRGKDGNFFLNKTLNYSGAKQYEDDISGLLRLLRNTRQHNVRGGVFALVVGHHFPELMGDFQKACSKKGTWYRRICNTVY